MKKLVSVEEMRTADAQAVAGGVSPKELMLRAAKGLLNSHHWKGKTAVVCGSGNNGGDGYALACLLKEIGKEVEVFYTAPPKSSEAIYYALEAAKCGVKSRACTHRTDLTGFDTAVDCILGTGSTGALKEEVLTAVRAVNRSGAFVVSCDLNTGLGGNSGLAEGEYVRSDLTVAIGDRKYGHVLGQAKDAMRAVSCVEIGIPTESNVYLAEREDAVKLFPMRPQYAHKGNFGKAGLMGGSVRYSGAAKLSNLAFSALRAGAGIANLIVPASIVSGVLPYVLESVLTPFPERNGHFKYDEKALECVLRENTSLAVGMGMGNNEDTKNIVAYLLQHAEMPLVLDADALNALAGQTHLLRQSKARITLTPHPAEFSRLCGVSVAEILKNPILYAVNFAKEHRITLLLKGTATVVTDGENTYLIDRGSVGQAAAGSGDVLSGILAAMNGYSAQSPALIAAGAAYTAGLAGEFAAECMGEYSAAARDTVSMIAKAVAEIGK